MHLAVLSAFAVAQPLFDLLGRNAEFFTIRGSTRSDIVVFALGIAVLPPLAMLVLEALSGVVDRKLRLAVHLGFIAFLTGLLALQSLKLAGVARSSELLLAAGLLATLAALAYLFTPVARSFLTVLAPVPLIFLGLFLFHSPAAKLTLGSSAQASVSKVSARSPIVMILLDEFPVTSLMDPQGRIDAVRYPNFAALAKSSTWFRNTTTVGDETELAQPAIMTGRYSKRGQLPIFADHPKSVFTLLGGSYRMDVFEGETSLCPPQICKQVKSGSFRGRMSSLASDLGVVYLHLLFPRALEERLPSISTTWMNFRSGSTSLAAESPAARRERLRTPPQKWWADRKLQFESFVASIKPSRQPTLYFLQIGLPHSHWEYLPSGRRYPYTEHTIAGRTDWGRDPFTVESGFQHHLLQVGFTDRLLGQLMRKLRRVGLYDRSLILVTPDHGVSFVPGDKRRAVTVGNFPDIAFIPFFFKKPHQRTGRIDNRHARTIDVLPTLADALDIPLPWPVDGQALLARNRTDPPVVIRGKFRTLTSSAAALEARRDKTLRRQIRTFGWGKRPPGLYGIGPRPQLLGREVASLPTRPGSAEARIDSPTLFRNVRPRSELVPAAITGGLSGPGATPGRDVAVAVNGRIEAVGRSFVLGGKVWFSVTVPESSLRPGANSVDVFFATGPPGGTVLEPL